MKTLSLDRIRELVEPYYQEPADHLLEQLGLYLDVLLRWNAWQNLTAIRDPEMIVRRHFGESLFLAAHLPSEAETLLDLGSGAGFPGLPVQLTRPELRVTLAESQSKKAFFLREVVRQLSLMTEVWGGRAEDLPRERRFDVVTLRAVDNPHVALRTASSLCRSQGTVAHLTTVGDVVGLTLQRIGGSTEFFPLPQEI